MLALLAERHLDPGALRTDDAFVAAWAKGSESPMFDRVVLSMMD